jgi:hypothetical protein
VEKTIRIIVVLLAGAKKEMWWWKFKLWYWTAWPPFKWFPLRFILAMLGCRTKIINELKAESIARLRVATGVYMNSIRVDPIDFIIIPDSYSPLRKKQVGFMAKDYLTEGNIPGNKILVLTGEAINTSDKAKLVANEVRGLANHYQNCRFVLHLVTSYYNMKRAEQSISNALADYCHMQKVQIITHEALPLETKECLQYEMAYNLWAEKWKSRIEKYPWLKNIIYRMEKKGRESYKIKK